MLQHALNVVMANHMATCPNEESLKFKVAFIERMKGGPELESLPPIRWPGQEQAEAAIAQRAAQMAEQFMQQVQENENSIRKIREAQEGQ